MSDFLFVTWDGGGNVPPALGIAAELAGRGHSVRVLGHPQQADAVARGGLAFTTYRRARPFRGADENTVFSYLAMFGDRGMGSDLMAELERQPADLVVIDCLLFGAMAAADDAGLRYAVLEHLFHEYLERKWLRGPLGLGMWAKRLAPSRRLGDAALRLVATLPELDPAAHRGGSGNLRYTGPVVEGSPAAPESPTILVSLSTNHFPGQRQTLQNILDACGGLDARVVATIGQSVEPGDLHWSANTEVHRWLSHAELLPNVSLVIGHGGHATTMIALAHDIPLLVLPLHAMLDQPMVGKAVEASGAGRLLPRNTPADQLVPVITELLGDGPHRAAAAGLGAAIRNRPGARAGADALLSLITAGNGAPSAAD